MISATNSGRVNSSRFPTNVSQRCFTHVSLDSSKLGGEVSLDAVSRNVVLSACAGGAQWDLALNCWAAAPATQRGAFKARFLRFSHAGCHPAKCVLKYICAFFGVMISYVDKYIIRYM